MSNVTLWTTNIHPTVVPGEWSEWYYAIEGYFYGVAEFYENLGATVDTLPVGHLTETTLDSTNLLIVMCPTEDFTASDITYMKDYLATGGRIVFWAENDAWIPQINGYITNAIAALGGSFSIMSEDHNDIDGDYVLSSSNISSTSELAEGVDALYYNAASKITYTGAVDVVATGDDGSGFIVDQAVDKGRIFLFTDVNLLSTVVSSYTDLGAYQIAVEENWGLQATIDSYAVYNADMDVLLENLLTTSEANQAIVTAGGNPNGGFGGSPSAEISAPDFTFINGENSYFTFTVNYKVASDSTATFTNGQFDSGDLTVKDSADNSYTVALDTSVGGGTGIISGAGTGDVVVQYKVTAPDSTWDTADAGAYTIGIVNAAVEDTDGKQLAGDSAAAVFDIDILASPVITEFSFNVTNTNTYARPWTPGDHTSSDVDWSATWFTDDIITANSAPNTPQSDDSFNYVTVTLVPALSGNFTATVTGATGLYTNDGTQNVSDTQIWIYKNSFDPLNPLVNVLAVNEDIDYQDADGVTVNWLSEIKNVTFEAGETYILVVTTYTAGTTGTVDFQISGPSVVSVSGDTVTGTSIASASYDASTGTLVVTGTGMNIGDPIDASVLTITGEDGNTYTLAGSYTVTASSATSFTVVLDATDKLNVNGILNKNGTASADSTTFNLAAGANWVSGADADSTGNGITVSNVTAPTITETSYNASTGVLTVTATNLVHLPGAANDIDASAFTFTGEGGATYTLTNTSDVEITSSTSFTITLSSTDKDGVADLITANGTSSDDSTTYNISASDDWNGTITGGSIADATSSVTVSGFSTNDAAVLDLNGATAGTDNTVALADAADGLAPDVVISDTENDSAGWDGCTLTIHRVDSNGDADGNVHDVFGFASGSGLTVTGSIAEGADSNGTLASGGTTFATWSYYSSSGELVLSFNSDATSALVQAAAAAVTYTNGTPYGDAKIEFALNDGVAVTTAEVTVTSTVIHVTQTDYDTDGDTADGMSLYEALAIAKDGDTILLDDGVYRGQFNITKNVTIDAVNGADGNVTIESPDSTDLVQVLPDMLTNNGHWRMPVLNVDTDDLSGTVTIKNITVDGRDQGLADGFANNKDLLGIGIVDSNVVIDGVTLTNFRCTDSGEWGWGENFPIMAEGSAGAGGTVSVSILNSDISNYQKTGIIGWGPTLDITIDGTTITGSGVAGIAGQNGIQIGSGGDRTGTTATITDNIIQNLGFDSADYSSSGVVLVYADDTTITGNSISGVTGGEGNLNGVDIMNAYDGDTEINISGNTFTDVDTAIVNEPDNAYSLIVGSNDFSGATVAFYDAYDISDPATETPVETPTVINITSSEAPASGVLSYYMFGGNDSFTDNGSVDSTVYGGAGDDTVTTGSGDDIIAGGTGDDTLTGGDGEDVFMYLSQEMNSDGDRVMYNVTDFGADTITDFTTSDVIRVAGADFDDYTAVSGDGLNVAANTVEVVQTGGNTTLYIDTDGVAGADLQVVLEGTYTSESFTFDGTDIGLAPSIGISSAAYNAATGVLTVTGFGLTVGDVIDASKLSVTGEGGNSYTLAGTYTVTATADGFALTLNEADQLNVEGILNSNGTSAAGGATFNIAASAGWNTTASAAADTTGNPVTVSSLAAPAISGVTYNAETGVITVTGSNFVKQSGAANDIDVSKFTFTGQGGNVTLSTTSDVEISSATTFTITLSSTDKSLVNAALDKNGTESSGGTVYHLSAADDWNGPVTGSNTADTANAVTVSNVKVVDTVDGVPVTSETVTQTQTYTDLDGNTVTREVETETMTVAPVTDTRVNDTGATNTAEIPLFWGESSRTEWATTASLPVGVGITTTGTRSPVDERTLNDAIGDLLFYIDSTASSTDAGRTAMLSGGSGFLESISDSSNTLVVNKVTLTVSGTDVPAAPIVINGTPNTVTSSEGAATPKEAIVIDASALPAGTELDLQNIEFAVIIGSGVIVRGGDGANIVFAGEGSQNILLGADDDELHAGAGDDVVGSLAGDDLIYGESGNDRMSGGAGKDFMHGGSGTDTVVYTGSMSDYIITRDHGLTYISHVSDPSDVDTLVNAEQVEFSDGTYEVQNSEELTFIASLYEQILDRQPEINGFQYWSDAVFEKDLSVGDMTVWFMKSAEYHDATGVDFASLTVEDQVEQLYVALLGRPSDAEGKAYWVDCIEQGHTIAEVAESFVTSVEMQGIYNLPNEWDFTA
ncbi:DUF4214 domain-containing protein [Seleniivibrio woodruffii]|uniref:DUF4214 domain-containing protein n=1 Tax=Seleniivibrio woodruffii TaxID=1078050 RepID=UPI0026EAC1F8|nr:DUF4214 domain-containing protein [Seleniivibrio woodruffii]